MMAFSASQPIKMSALQQRPQSTTTPMANLLTPDFAAQTHWSVAPNWLAAHLDPLQIVVIDCRFSLADPQAGAAQYAINHIPGAHYFDLNQDLSSPVQTHGGRHPLPDPLALAAKLSACGVSHEKLVVVYDDQRLAFASRLWWLLRYYGHDRVVVLDGGWSRWQAEGHPVTAAQPKSQLDPQPFVPQIRSDWICDIEAIKATAPLLIDSREVERYRGEQEPIDPVAGHIPGALNYPWQGITDAEGQLLSPELQRQRWENLPAGEPVVYCGSGVTACVNLLSLAIAGREAARLYPGSWSDWCSYL